MDSEVELTLLGGFSVTYTGKKVDLSLGAQRLLSFLALQDAGMSRATVGEQLWPDSPHRRAAANLRSVLWQIRRACDDSAIASAGPGLLLRSRVHVDLRAALHEARQILEGNKNDAEKVLQNYHKLIPTLSRDLLPDWLDEWLILARERWNHVRLHALESLAQLLLRAEKYLPALEAALAATAIEPVRESAHRTVLQVYLAEGNSGCAIKHYQRYRGMLHRELGVSPSTQMTRLVHPSPRP